MTQVELAESVFSKLAVDSEFIPESEETMELGTKFHSLKYFINTNFIDPKVVEVYQKVGLILSRYKSGKIPKAFKVIPTLKNWEEVLALTSPEKWTANAMLEATKIFASNLPPKVVERYYHIFYLFLVFYILSLIYRFYHYILLEAVRRNFDETKTVNVHYFQAMKKAIYKPAAFFKGIIFPVVHDTLTTLKEASVYCGVISGTSIPNLHAAAALMKISTGEYTGPKFMIIRALLDKKFALPVKSISVIFDYFCSFRQSETALPVLWHQTLLVFVQRYKSEFDTDRKKAIRQLVDLQNHAMISPEIIRELESS